MLNQQLRPGREQQHEHDPMLAIGSRTVGELAGRSTGAGGAHLAPSLTTDGVSAAVAVALALKAHEVGESCWRLLLQSPTPEGLLERDLHLEGDLHLEQGITSTIVELQLESESDSDSDAEAIDGGSAIRLAGLLLANPRNAS